ncbi:MAG TPA: PH domain-containing protein [Candidatus Micrarchaeota archaeon]|nr:PH domain-containing protein [Candidatus Micrarchaeota archaeon]
MEKHLKPALSPYTKLYLGLIALLVIAGSIASTLYPDYIIQIIAVVGVLSALAVAKLLHYAYRHYFTEYVIDDSEISMVYGIWAKDEKHIPIEKIEDYNILRTVSGKILGVADIGIQTARGESGFEVVLRSIREKDAEEIDVQLDRQTRIKAK